MDYNEYINSEEWSKLREQRLILSGRQCEACHNDRRLLHGHHMNYRNLTDCTVEDLVALCTVCHRIIHLELKRRCARSRDFNREQTIAIIRGSPIPPKTKLSRRQKRALRKLEKRQRRKKVRFRPRPKKIQFINGGKHARSNRVIDGLVQQIKDQEMKEIQHLSDLILNHDADPF